MKQLDLFYQKRLLFFILITNLIFSEQVFSADSIEEKLVAEFGEYPTSCKEKLLTNQIDCLIKERETLLKWYHRYHFIKNKANKKNVDKSQLSILNKNTDIFLKRLDLISSTSSQHFNSLYSSLKKDEQSQLSLKSNKFRFLSNQPSIELETAAIKQFNSIVATIETTRAKYQSIKPNTSDKEQIRLAEAWRKNLSEISKKMDTWINANHSALKKIEMTYCFQ